MEKEIKRVIKDYFKIYKKDKLIYVDVWKIELSQEWYITTIAISPNKVIFKETWKYNPENFVCKVEFIGCDGCL